MNTKDEKSSENIATLTAVFCCLNKIVKLLSLYYLKLQPKLWVKLIILDRKLGPVRQKLLLRMTPGTDRIGRLIIRYNPPLGLKVSDKVLIYTSRKSWISWQIWFVAGLSLLTVSVLLCISVLRKIAGLSVSLHPLYQSFPRETLTSYLPDTPLSMF